ncbi:MAG TPA: NADH-quinone oxidoreductase subunit N [Saprospiraceae bacterium]|nr:NADH-quinone oxidoreductase subunit N [Saprospiraceae bacterium]HQW57085.1 NADH-quinone oxidoreductase subunit N [Saprospiraceae bacterium]
MLALGIVFAGALLILFAGLFAKRDTLQFIGIVTALTTLFVSVNRLDIELPIAQSMLHFDHFAFAFITLMAISALLVFLISGYGLRYLGETLGDNYGLLLFSLCGAIIMASFANMTMLFLGLEIMSIPLYVLAGSKRDSLGSNEAALKYFLMGAFATGFLLLGIALLYGATGTFDIEKMGTVIAAGGLKGYGYLGFIMLTVGLGFKISAAPFHFWSPDVYTGSPTVITTFMASVVKIAGFAALLRLFQTTFLSAAPEWSVMMGGLACLTMIVGNLGALMQDNFKRLLAYSSISHAGYLLLGVVAIPFDSISSMVYYLLAYSLATISAFTIFMVVSEQNGTESIKAFNGLGRSKPLLAIIMTISLLSMAGIPPLAGFLGKYFLFVKAMEVNPMLVIIAVINSAISVAYYLKPVVAMYFTTKDPIDNVVRVPMLVKFSLIASMVLILLMMIFPGFVQMWPR